MDSAYQPTAGTPIRPETRRRLSLLLYHPRHSGDPDVVLRFARQRLGRPSAVQSDILRLPEEEARQLADALEQAFPDRTTGLAAKVAKEFGDRLD